jgi:hypothetical protein
MGKTNVWDDPPTESADQELACTPAAARPSVEESSADKIFRMEDFPVELFLLNTEEECTLQVIN